MSPYIVRPAGRSGTLESTAEDRETAYIARNATIRTVVSSDPIAPRRPTFFTESVRGREGMGQMFGDVWGPPREYPPREIVESVVEKPARESGDRPQTSPHSPLSSHTFFIDRDEDERDMHWPRKGILHHTRTNESAGSSSRKGSVVSSQGRKHSVASNPIVDIAEIERYYNEAQAMDNARFAVPQLGLDTGDLDPPKGGWFGLSGSTTPTVTLQGDEGGQARVLEDEDERESNDGMELSEEDMEMARKIFMGDEEFMAKDRAAAWLGDK